QAEVCAFGSSSCVEGLHASGLHGFDMPGVTRVITLPIDTSSNIYLHLSAAGRLAFEFLATDARLAVHVTRPGGADVPLCAPTGSAATATGSRPRPGSTRSPPPRSASRMRSRRALGPDRPRHRSSRA